MNSILCYRIDFRDLKHLAFSIPSVYVNHICINDKMMNIVSLVEVPLDLLCSFLEDLFSCDANEITVLSSYQFFCDPTGHFPMHSSLSYPFYFLIFKPF